MYRSNRLIYKKINFDKTLNHWTIPYPRGDSLILWFRKGIFFLFGNYKWKIKREEENSHNWERPLLKIYLSLGVMFNKFEVFISLDLGFIGCRCSFHSYLDRVSSQTSMSPSKHTVSPHENRNGHFITVIYPSCYLCIYQTLEIQ